MYVVCGSDYIGSKFRFTFDSIISVEHIGSHKFSTKCHRYIYTIVVYSAVFPMLNSMDAFRVGKRAICSPDRNEKHTQPRNVLQCLCFVYFLLNIHR